MILHRMRAWWDHAQRTRRLAGSQEAANPFVSNNVNGCFINRFLQQHLDVHWLENIMWFGRAGIGSCVLVLSTESVGKKWRGQIGIVGFFFSTLGFISLPALAYLNRSNSWRTLYLQTSISAILYCIIIQFCINESPNWLLEQGKIF